MSEREDPFHDRLLQAFVHLSDERQALIRIRMDEAGIEGGLKAGIARLVGIKTPSLLSDMLSGRAKGKRYQAELAELLGVSQDWLHGDDTSPPDWALPPIEAYERWILGLRKAWRDWFGDTGAGGTEASLSRSLDAPLLGEETRWQALALSAADRRAIGQRLLLAAHDERLTLLLEGSWELVPFELLEKVADTLGHPPPDHRETVDRGHAQAGDARKQQDWIAKRLAHRLQRYWLPPQLFRVTRLALVSLRQQRAYLGKDTAEIDDALELLWRQQLQKDGRRDETPPAAFTEETGRERWSRLSLLQDRYRDDDADPADKYRSHGPWDEPSAPD